MHMCCEFRPANRCFARHLLVEIMHVCVNMCVHIQINMHSVWSKFYQILYATSATALTLTFSSYKIMVKDYFEMLLKKGILTSKQLAQQVFIGQNTLQSTFWQEHEQHPPTNIENKRNKCHSKMWCNNWQKRLFMCANQERKRWEVFNALTFIRMPNGKKERHTHTVTSNDIIA